MSHFNDDGQFSVRVVEKERSFLHDVTEPITEKELENPGKFTDILNVFVDRFSYDFKVSELKKRYSSKDYSSISFYASEGMGKKFKYLHPDYTGKLLSELSGNGILLIVVSKYQRKWDDEADEEPYPGWQSLLYD